MNELQAWYRQGLGAFIDALEIAREDLLNPEHRENAIGTLKRVAHNLRGSGSSYGFPDITTAATELESAIIKAETTHLDNRIAEPLEKLVESIKEAILSSELEAKVGILLIDDDIILANLLTGRLAAPNRDIFVAKNGVDAERILAEQTISLIILDLTLPDIDGRILLARLRESPSTAAIPVIVVSVPSGSRPKAECFALGADIYFEKPFEMDELSAAVAAKLRRNAEMTRDARKDSLTRLPNRAAFSEVFLRVRLLHDRERNDLSVAILDLDHFKSVNDTYGHKIGDDVLRKTAEVISSSFRKSDYFARWGGEEFVVLFPHTNQQGAVLGLEKALEAMRKIQFLADDGREFKVSFSAGVVDVPEGSSVDEAIAAADRYLYLAKEQGRNRVVTSESKAQVMTKKVLLADDDVFTAAIIRRHLEKEGFEVIHVVNGRDALKMAAEQQISLFILDVKMPEMDGFELLSQIRDLTSFVRTPVIIVTAVGEDSQIVRGFELGADDYMTKPFSPVELSARIHRLLKRR